VKQEQRIFAWNWGVCLLFGVRTHGVHKNIALYYINENEIQNLMVSPVNKTYHHHVLAVSFTGRL